MSVQNPERLATKQDLKDMYDRIRPYMGGLPEVVANKFSKGDLYDTSEKMIGKWIDGKPLYQKVVSATIPTTKENPTLVDIGASIDFAMIAEAVYDNGSNSYIETPAIGGNLSPNNHRGVRVFARMDSQWFAFSPTVIIQYTKTTDTPNT